MKPCPWMHFLFLYPDSFPYMPYYWKPIIYLFGNSVSWSLEDKVLLWQGCVFSCSMPGTREEFHECVKECANERMNLGKLINPFEFQFEFDFPLFQRWMIIIAGGEYISWWILVVSMWLHKAAPSPFHSQKYPEPDNKLFIIIIIFYYFYLAALHGMRDLSSPTRDRTRASCSGSAES